MTMTVDGQIRQAGARLAVVPVRVPEIEVLVRHHRRRRSLAAGAVLATVLVTGLVVGAGRGDNRGDRIETGAADAGPPSGSLIGLGEGMGVWPDDGRRLTTAADLGSAFAADVLGWDDVEVSVDPEVADSPTTVTISGGATRSVEAVAAPLEGAWTFMQIGTGSGMMAAEVDATDTRVLIPNGPPGTASVRWWARLDGEETTGIHPGRTNELILSGSPEALGALVVLYLDNHQAVLDVVGGTFGTPDDSLVPPSTGHTSAGG